MGIYMGASKFGPYHFQKLRRSYTFLKKGEYYIPGCAEKGGYSARTSVLCHILGMPSEVLNLLLCRIC